jgi:hypothetical protein
VERSPHARIILAWLILSYLSVYPFAADTVVGISRWWLVVEGFEVDMLAVAVVVEQLVLCGWLKALQLPGQKRLYQLNQARRPLLENVLRHPPSFMGFGKNTDSPTPTTFHLQESALSKDQSASESASGNPFLTSPNNPTG